MSPYYLSTDFKFNKLRKNKSEEAITQLQIIRYLRSKNYPCGKIKTKGSFTKQGRFILDKYQWTGLPDLMVFTPKLLFIECKSEKGKMSEAQKDFQEFCRKAGVRYILAHLLDDVIKEVG